MNGRRLLSEVNGFQLWRNGDFYSVIYPSGKSAVNTSGSREEVLAEMKRWKEEVDSENEFMLKVENAFIFVLENQY